VGKLIRLALLCLAALASAPLHAQWQEASSRHFVVYSKGSPAFLQEFTTKLERFDKAMRLIHHRADEDLGPANRITVYVVDDVTEVRRLGHFGGASSIAGFYLARASGSVAVVPRTTESDLEPTTILLHEYAHHFMLQSHSAAFPAWLVEGFAEFTATAKFEKDGSVGFGAAAMHRGYGLTHTEVPIEALFDPVGHKLSGLDWEATVYGRGWLLTHYLMFDPSRKGQLDRYIAEINGGKSSLDAARIAFGDLRVLEQRLKAYLRQNRIPYSRIAAEQIPIRPVSVRILRPGEAAIMELRIRSRVGVTEEEAPTVARKMRAAAEPYASDATVQAALAEAEFDADNLDGAEAAATRALAADPKNVEALLFKARIRMKRAQAPSAPATLWTEARRFVSAANRADPEDAEPLVLFYTTFREQGITPTANAVEGLLSAFELAPHDVGLRLAVARQHLVDGDARQAREVLGPIAFDPHRGKLAETVGDILAKLAAGGTKPALEAWEAMEKKEKEEDEKRKKKKAA
jgi:tetratricopeptide (TPR) repeat protein